MFCHRNILIFCTEDLNHLWVKSILMKVDQLLCGCGIDFSKMIYLGVSVI